MSVKITMAKTICLSAGHGAGDPGVVHKNLKEFELTMKIVKRAVEMIRIHGQGALEVPDYLTLTQTIDWINQRPEINICVEVHINSGGGHGVEGWNYQGGPNESDKLSQFLVDAVVVETKLLSRGIKDETQNNHGRLGFVHDTNPIAALIEIAFIDGDYDFLNSDENLTKAAKGVARGCLSYLGIKWQPELINPIPPLPSTDPCATQNAQIKSLNDQIANLKSQLATQTDKANRLENFRNQVEELCARFTR